jgi:hypothetical protein
MTKSRERGESVFTDQAKREAARTGRHICDVLDKMLDAAVQAKDKALQKEIVKAQKFLKCRNRATREK